MTPDDPSIPDDDNVARAARDGLRRLAGSHAPMPLDWEHVVSGARRVQPARTPRARRDTDRRHPSAYHRWTLTHAT